MFRSFATITAFALVASCASKKQVTEPLPAPDPATVATNASTDAGVVDAVDAALDATDLGSDDAAVDAAADGTGAETDAAVATGQLCIKGPGTHSMVGKGSSNREDVAAFEARAKKVNGGMILSIEDRNVTVRGKDGGTLDGLDLTGRHRVKVRFVDGGSHHGFLLRFPDGTRRMCAYYNEFYDNWRLRPVGKRGCGPCQFEQ